MNGVRGVPNEHCLQTPPIRHSELPDQESLDCLVACGDVDRFTDIDRGIVPSVPLTADNYPLSAAGLVGVMHPIELTTTTIRRGRETIGRYFAT